MFRRKDFQYAPIRISAAMLAGILSAPLCPVSAEPYKCASDEGYSETSSSERAAVAKLLAKDKIELHMLCQSKDGAQVYARLTYDPQSGPNSHLYNSIFIGLLDLLHKSNLVIYSVDDELAIQVVRTKGRQVRVNYAPWNLH